jgi:shikimate dehydrogenase
MFYSLSQYPGSTGEFYYNIFFKKLGLPYTYTALQCTDLSASVNEMKERALGFSVSMPFKERILDYLDVVDPNVAKYSTCNTVVIKNGIMKGFSSDFYGAQWVSEIVPPNAHVAVLGDGSMGSLIYRTIGANAEIFSRSKGNWDRRYGVGGVVINCTSFGTSTTESPFYALPPIKMVIDLAIKDNQLKEQCAMAGIKYVAGIEFYKRQFVKQFEIYTGTRLNLWDFENI